MKNKMFRGSIIFILLFGMAIVFALTMGSGATGKQTELAYDEFILKVESNEVSSIIFYDTYIVGLNKDSKVSEETFPKDYDFKVSITDQTIARDDVIAAVAKRIGKKPDEVTTSDYGFKVDYKREQNDTWVTFVVPYLVIALILGGLFFLFMRQVQGTNNRAMSFGKSRAKPLNPNQKKVTFDDVAGADEEKEELAEIVEFLKDPKKFVKMGARIPKGVLLMGPP